MLNWHWLYRDRQAWGAVRYHQKWVLVQQGGDGYFVFSLVNGSIPAMIKAKKREGFRPKPKSPRGAELTLAKVERRHILRKLIQQIIADLTIGRTDEGRPPVPKNKIRTFLLRHRRRVEQLVDAIYHDFHNEAILDKPDDLYREYLYTP